MPRYEFTVIFALPKGTADPAAYEDALFEAGCDDAIVGSGTHGAIALEFSREAESAEEAVRSAIDAVRRAIPGSELIEVKPDLVNLADVADLVGCSRQNIRKYAVGEMKTVQTNFPPPTMTGSPSLWHLSELATWLVYNGGMNLSSQLLEIAHAACRINLDIARRYVDESPVLFSRPKFRALPDNIPEPCFSPMYADRMERA